MRDANYRRPVMEALEKLEEEETANNNSIQPPEEMPIYRSYVKLGKKSLQATWDSGAQKSTVTEPLAKLLGLEWDKRNTSKVTTIDGAENTTLGIMRQANLRVKEQHTPIDIQVVKSKK